ncbi:MAG TPA: DUF4410 domain-containing protein [Methylomirabilota bacterium]|jgi:hypothetical protein
MRARRVVAGLWLFVVVAAAVGCAGSAGSTKTLATAPEPGARARYTKVVLATTAEGPAAGMDAADRERIAALVARKIKERAPGRVVNFAGTTTDAVTDPDTMFVTIAFTRYDPGNAFARFTLAGLGQIHVNADVTLEDRARPAVLGEFAVTKTFAWGGIYGGLTDIKDVEDGFAEAVANVVLGEPS